MSNHSPYTVNVVVEAMVDSSCPIDFSVLKLELGEFLTKSNAIRSYVASESKSRTSFVACSPVDLSSAASDLIRRFILECNLVELDCKGDSKLLLLGHLSTTNTPTTKEDPMESSLLESSSASSTTATMGNLSLQSSNNDTEDYYDMKITIHTFILNEDPPEPEEIHDPAAHADADPITVCDTLLLPHISLHTSWENLIFSKSLKRNLLSYANTALLFAHKNVSSHIINWNRVLMFYGPPGTGKTSLCRALAHKLSIQMQHIYTSGGYLLEIKSHSLFSKWFSESGKLIARLFDRIRELVQDEPDALFCVLIDEVESLAGSRAASQSGSEPSDAIRAVNSLLTSLDSIRQYKNVLILTTTNLTDCIDSAFVDRVDWMVKVDLPNVHARYEILRGCIIELGNKGILLLEQGGNCQDSEENPLPSTFYCMKDYHHALFMEERDAASGTMKDLNMTHAVPELMLLECSKLAHGLSGRSLRKLPFQTFAFHVGSSNPSISDFLLALKSSISMRINGDF